VLTFGGEQVVLPFVEHHADHPQSPALTLDRLAEAFANLGAPVPAEATPTAQPAETTSAADTAAPGQAAGRPEAGNQARRLPAAEEKDYSDHTADQSRTRRPRRNRSASRAQGAANATSVEHHEAVPTASTGHSHAAKAPEHTQAPAAPKAAAEAPIILGVGVPASEL
jgi:ribonuclease E